jgi:phosphoglycolate phosphatase
MSGRRLQVRAVLFDLDGTLIDSAPDLAGSANDMRAARGMAPLPIEHLRPMVGAGARGMLLQAFGIGPRDTAFGELKDEFLARYEDRLTRETRVFDTMSPIIDALDARGLPWGVVTNKVTRLAAPILESLGLAARAAVLIGGDTTPHAKPHPEPLLEAARRLRVEARECIYVGDDHRDVQAGRAAGMPTVAAAWGYLGLGEPIHAWGADHLIEHPRELLKLLRLD